MEEYQVSKIYQLETLLYADRVAELQSMLRKTEGINAGEVLVDESRVKIVFDRNMISSDKIKLKISEMGFKVLSEV